MTTRSRPRADGPEPGRATVTFPRHWWSFAGAMGGAVGATLLDTAATVVGPDRRVRTATVQFLRPVREDELVLDAAVLREGRSSTVVTVTGTVPDGEAVRATVLLARDAGPGFTWAATPAPAVPAAADCEEVTLPRALVPFSEHLELRFATPARPEGRGPVAELVAWVRLRSGGAYGAAELALLCDVMPPGLFAVASRPVPMPTLDLSVVVAEQPPSEGFVLVRMRTRQHDHHWCVDDCDLWSAEGVLLAQSRQSRQTLAGEDGLLG